MHPNVIALLLLLITRYIYMFERKRTTLTRRRAYRDGILVVYMNECYLGNYPLIQTPHLLHGPTPTKIVNTGKVTRLGHGGYVGLLGTTRSS